MSDQRDWAGGRPVVGVLHSGKMGAAIGSALKPVASAAAGRSYATSKRAESAHRGLRGGSERMPTRRR